MESEWKAMAERLAKSLRTVLDYTRNDMPGKIRMEMEKERVDDGQ